MRAAQRVLIDLGNGTVVYEGIQGVDCPEITVWRFRFYGGMILSENLAETSTEIGAMSWPIEIVNADTQ